MPQNNAYTDLLKEKMLEAADKQLTKGAKETAASMSPEELAQLMSSQKQQIQEHQQSQPQAQMQQPAQAQQQAQDPNQILQGLLKMIGSGQINQEQIMQGISQLAQAQVEIPGSKKGLMGMLQSGGSFRDPRTQAYGIDEASKLVKRLVDTSTAISGESREQFKFPIEVEKALLDVQKTKYEIPKTQAEAGMAQLNYMQEIANRSPNGEQFMQSYLQGLNITEQLLQQTGKTIESTNSPIQQQLDERAATKMEQYDKVTTAVERQRDPITGEPTAKAKAKENQVRQEALDSLKAAQNSRNAQLRISGTFDDYLNLVNETHRISGQKPGVLGGIITASLGKAQMQEFYEGFKGGLVEYAAAAGANAIPGARAVRLIALFEGTAPNIFSSLPGAINNTAVSFRNALFADMRANPTEYMPNYDGSIEHNKKLAQMGKKFYDDYSEGAYMQAYAKNPELVPAKYRREIEQKLRSLSRKQLESIASKGAK